MQVFFWIGPGNQRDGRTYYNSFQLDGVTYNIGDSVYLFPENENQPHYIGRIVTAFVDEHSGHADPHCIQVKWYERRVNLEESTRGIEESEREVFELEDIDVNPIGCISGKNNVIKARAYDEAYQRMRGTEGDWYFCRGYFLQTTNAFQPYTAAELEQEGVFMASHEDEEAGAVHSQPAPPARPPASHASNANRATKKSSAPVTGRVCVQCGATQTPQWREGPTGPKTLCNACGVRYNRAQAKAQKKNGQPAGGGGRGQGGAAGGHQRQATAASSASPPGRGRKRPAQDQVTPDQPSKMEQRPQRQAAKEALARTAAYARTGEFGEDQADGDDALDHDGLSSQQMLPGQQQVASEGLALSSGGGMPQPNMDPTQTVINRPPQAIPSDTLSAPLHAGLKMDTSAAGINSSGPTYSSPTATSQLPIAALDLQPANNPSLPVPNTQLGSPEALLDIPSLVVNPTTMPPSDTSSQLPGIHASDISSILGLSLGAGGMPLSLPGMTNTTAMTAPGMLATTLTALKNTTYLHGAASRQDNVSNVLPANALTSGINTMPDLATIAGTLTQPGKLNSTYDSSIETMNPNPSTSPNGLHSVTAAEIDSKKVMAAVVEPQAVCQDNSSSLHNQPPLQIPCIHVSKATPNAVMNSSVLPANSNHAMSDVQAATPTSVAPAKPGNSATSHASEFASPAAVTQPEPLSHSCDNALSQPPSLLVGPVQPATSGVHSILALLSAQSQQAHALSVGKSPGLQTGFLQDASCHTPQHMAGVQPLEPLFAGLDALPAGKVSEYAERMLSDVRDKAYTAQQKSAAADVAVSAVARVYQARQEAAEQARLAAMAAGQQLKDYLNTLIQAHGVEALAGGFLQLQQSANSSTSDPGDISVNHASSAEELTKHKLGDNSLSSQIQISSILGMSDSPKMELLRQALSAGQRHLTDPAVQARDAAAIPGRHDDVKGLVAQGGVAAALQLLRHGTLQQNELSLPIPGQLHRTGLDSLTTPGHITTGTPTPQHALTA